MTSASEKKWRPFNCFFSWVGLRTYQQPCTYSFTYLLTYSRSSVLPEKLTGFQLVKKFPSYYGKRRFNTAFTNARCLSLSTASSIQSIPPTSHFLKDHLDIIFPSTPGSPKCSLPLQVSPPKPCTRLASLLIRATYPAHLTLLDFYHPNIIG